MAPSENTTASAGKHPQDNWFQQLNPAVQQEVRRLDRVITDLITREHQTIYPPQHQIYRALRLVPPHKVKAIIIGQDPYHGPHQANGLAFSVDPQTKIPPSLRNIFLELADDLKLPPPQTGDLEPWARAGVLLLNATLTVRAHEANSHANLGWRAVTEEILRVALATPQPKVLICWGNFAYGIAKNAVDEIEPTNVRVLRSTHPSPFSAYNSSAACPAFMGSKPFSKTNAFLVAHGVDPIDWRLP